MFGVIFAYTAAAGELLKQQLQVAERRQPLKSVLVVVITLPVGRGRHLTTSSLGIK